MKIRSDYVSNSSSSSFIVISTSKENYEDSSIKMEFGEFCDSEYSTYEFPNKRHKHQFGWEFENTSDFGGKLNFIGIQLLNLFIMSTSQQKQTYYRGNAKEDFSRYYSMVKKVCLEHFGMRVRLDASSIKVAIDKVEDSEEFYPLFYIAYDMYIDHQSCVTENQCMEMFNSEDDLYNFLANSESHVSGGNDNTPDL